MVMSIAQRKKNIRALPTSELKTYASAYSKGQIYKFARDTAIAELKKRKRKFKKIGSGLKKRAMLAKKQKEIQKLREQSGQSGGFGYNIGDPFQAMGLNSGQSKKKKSKNDNPFNMRLL